MTSSLMINRDYLLQKINEKLDHCLQIMDDDRITKEGYDVTKGKVMAFEEIREILK